ncbi:hypothetical protein ACOMHN_014652 [Nucella lapillus]
MECLSGAYVNTRGFDDDKQTLQPRAEIETEGSIEGKVISKLSMADQLDSGVLDQFIPRMNPSQQKCSSLQLKDKGFIESAKDVQYEKRVNSQYGQVTADDIKDPVNLIQDLSSSCRNNTITSSIFQRKRERPSFSKVDTPCGHSQCSQPNDCHEAQAETIQPKPCSGVCEGILARHEHRKEETNVGTYNVKRLQKVHQASKQRPRPKPTLLTPQPVVYHFSMLKHPGYMLTALLAVLTLLHCLPWSTAKVIRKQMSRRVITTRYGKVRGILVEFPNRHLKPVEAFFGLKYADLEKGNMRFMPPKNPKEQWTKIRAAIQQRPSCPQLTRHEREYEQALPEGRVAHLRNITPFLTDQIEDCLTLNLYVPIPKCEQSD